VPRWSWCNYIDTFTIFHRHLDLQLHLWNVLHYQLSINVNQYQNGRAHFSPIVAQWQFSSLVQTLWLLCPNVAHLHYPWQMFVTLKEISFRSSVWTRVWEGYQRFKDYDTSATTTTNLIGLDCRTAEESKCSAPHLGPHDGPDPLVRTLSSCLVLFGCN
jgi:hypothetical protein